MEAINDKVKIAIDYDLIGSPMMIDGLVKQIAEFESSDVSSNIESLAGNAMARLNNDVNSTTRCDSRGQTRTATTLLDKSLPVEEIKRYDAAIRLKKSARANRKAQINLTSDGRDSQSSTTQTGSRRMTAVGTTLGQVSIYSGPLHNDRSVDDVSTASLADRLANERMMQRSGYTWDQNGACAKIRLGDGSSLQNLYPSNSHIKLRNGEIERIDSYVNRVLSDSVLFKEVTSVKSYEYDQWARTKPLGIREPENSKLIPRERLESKSIQPTFDTLRTLNPVVATNRNKSWPADSLLSKFQQPKFLKRMGYLDESSTDKSKGTSDSSDIAEDEAVNDSSNNVNDFIEKTNKLTITDDDLDNRDEELSSDDEEYHKNEDDEEFNKSEVNDKSEESKEQEMNEEQGVKKTAESEQNNANTNNDNNNSTRSYTSFRKRQLSAYREKNVVGTSSDRAMGRVEQESIVKSLPISTVQIASSPSKRHQSDSASSRSGSKRHSLSLTNASKSNSKTQPVDFPSIIQQNGKKYVRFSQPVCLCPKLSQETLNSFYSPTTQRYLTNANGRLKCRLHDSKQETREAIILKSI